MIYTATEAARLLGVTRQTVSRYVRNGLLDAYHVGRKRAIRIDEAALQKFVAKQNITLIGSLPSMERKSHPTATPSSPRYSDRKKHHDIAALFDRL